MALADLLKRPDQSELRARLTAEALAAQNNFVRLQLAWSDAVADEAAGYGGQAASEAAEKALIEAKRQADKTKAVLDAINSRAMKTEADSEQAKVAEAWSKAERLAESRLKAARRLAASAEAFAKEWSELVRLTEELRGALPVVPDPDAALLWSIHVEDLVRKELLRLGIDWAYSWPWGKPSLPEFLPPFESTALVVKRWKDGAQHG